MNIAQHIPDNIKRVSRSIGYAAWLNTADDWVALPVILRARLDERQRVALAYSVLLSLDDHPAYLAASAALYGTLNGEVLGASLDQREAA